LRARFVAVDLHAVVLLDRKIVFSMFIADRRRDGSEAIYTMNADGSGLTSTGLGGDAADWGAASG
jgi:hypothetical protein